MKYFATPTDVGVMQTFVVMGLVYFVFMMAGAYTLSKNNHVRGDVLYGFFRPRTQAGIDLVLYFLFFLPGIVALTWAGWNYANEALAIRDDEVPITWTVEPPVFGIDAATAPEALLVQANLGAAQFRESGTGSVAIVASSLTGTYVLPAIIADAATRFRFPSLTLWATWTLLSSSQRSGQSRSSRSWT